VSSALRRFRAGYGASPWHLLGVLGSFALIGYVVKQTWELSTAPRMLVWFVGALLLHDLLLFPAYTLADRGLRAILERLPGRSRARERGELLVPLVNYVRIPLLAAGLLFLIFLPSITRQRAHAVKSRTGLTQEPYLMRWLVICLVLGAVSAVAYLVRVVLARRRAAAGR
jgi:hypothetical protein